MNDLLQGDATSLHETFISGEASAVEITEAHFERIASVEPSIRALIRTMDDEARLQAAALDDRRSRGEALGPLAGVPIVVKDILSVKGVPTTCGSRMLESYVPPYDATCIERLREAGAVLVGKANMDEFAMGSSTEHSAFSITRNPWDFERVPGGSSGGSAAAVAAREAPLALGTDTGGSIRQPAALTGVVGLKPTYGLVSRYGLIAFASSLDQAGPLARSVRDIGRCLAAIAGPDPRDMTTAPSAPGDYAGAASDTERSIEGLRVGIPREFFGEGLDPEIADAIASCERILEERGARLVGIALPLTEYAIATYYIVATAEASSNLARFDGVRYGSRSGGADTLSDMYQTTRLSGFGQEVKRRIMLGTYVLSAGYYDAYYLKAMKVRGMIREEFEKAFNEVDVIMGPTTPTTAFGLGERLNDPLAMYLQDIYTVTANLSAIPALSLPCGFSGSSLPIGCQLLGKRFGESTLLGVAAVLESELKFQEQAPPLAVDVGT